MLRSPSARWKVNKSTPASRAPVMDVILRWAKRAQASSSRSSSGVNRSMAGRSGISSVMLLFYSQSRAESNAACLESGAGEINFFVNMRHVLPETFNNKGAKARRKIFSNDWQATDSDLKIAHGRKIQISPASRKAVSTIEA